MHTAAITIQKRFWYARARWITRRRLQRRMEKLGLDYTRLKQAPMALDEFMKLIVSSPIRDTFAMWLRRVIRHASRDACDLLTETRPNRVLNSFLFAIYRETAVDMSLPGAMPLCQSSIHLCTLLDACMRAGNLKPVMTQLITALHTYLNNFNEWRRINERVIIKQLMHKAVARMHQLLEQRLPTASDNGIRLLAMRSFAVTGNPASIVQFMFNTTAMRVMEQASKNDFWGSHGLHTSRFVHELMIDSEFRLTHESTLSRLGAKYNGNHMKNDNELFTDIAAVIMWSCRKAEDIVELASIIAAQLPDNLVSTVDRVIRQVICALIPQKTASIVQEWEARMSKQQSNSESLGFLLHIARAMRNEIANNEIDSLRTKRFAELTNYMSQWDRIIPFNIKTHHWIQAAILRCNHITMHQRLAEGDPYALLQFHDNAIIDLVLPSRFNKLLPANHINPGTIPEILLFDVGRLQHIRHFLCAVCPSNGIVTSEPAFQTHFRELVSAGGSHPTSTKITEAADDLRSVIFVCRIRHGNTVARIAQEIARNTSIIIATQSMEQAE